MDNFVTLSQRLQNRAPQVGYVLAGQLVGDAWRALQARKDWSWRRKSGVFAPPTVYSFGLASTNSAAGNPTLVTGLNTTWTPQMIGRQIRIGGLNYPFYDIIGWLSPTQILLGQPWSGPDVTNQAYQILKCYYEVPEDFGYFDWCVSVKDGYKLNTLLSESDLALYDPQRSTQGQTYATAFRDFSSNYGGIIGPVIPVTSATNPAPISTTTFGFSYPTAATYIVQIVAGGVSGTATFQWMRAGQTVFQPIQTTDTGALDLSDGVQIYFPDTVVYVAGNLFVVNCVPMITEGVPRFELWPAPTFDGYLYPFQYLRKEYDITAQSPTLPPPIANRGEIILELALEKCALFPGQDVDHPNLYFSLQLANYHRQRAETMIEDLLSNDQEIGISNITYQNLPYAAGSPFFDGAWEQKHAPFL